MTLGHASNTQDIDKRVRAAESILGYKFTDRSLLQCALTHPSAAEADPVALSYERLEFLGDAILGAIVAWHLYERFPNVPEGVLTRIKVSLVSGTTLSKLNEELGFADLIIFGPSEEGTEGRGMHSALENVYESVVAALTIDGGLDVAQQWIHKTLGPLVSDDAIYTPKNPKTALQERLQVNHVTPTYELLEEKGPAHDPSFTVQVLADGKVIGHGEGHSKKEAESNAALEALKKQKKRRKR